ncbi:MAG: CPBP family intramembrane glutamic endopeptidase [Bacteroidales bacterium]
MNEINPKPYPSIPQSIGIIGLVILGMIVFGPIMLLGELIGEEPAILIYYIFGIGIPLWIIYAVKRVYVKDASFNFKVDNKRIIPYILLATIGLQLAITLPISNLIPLPDWAKEMFEQLATKSSNIYVFLTIVVVAPVLEEFIFRGIMLDGLLKRYSPHKAIIVSSILFGFVHLNPWQLTSAFILGLFIGWVYFKTRSISIAIIIHAFNNFTATLPIFMGATDDPVEESLVDIAGGLTNLILVISSALVVFLLMLYLINKEFNKTKAKHIATEKEE